MNTNKISINLSCTANSSKSLPTQASSEELSTQANCSEESPTKACCKELPLGVPALFEDDDAFTSVNYTSLEKLKEEIQTQADKGEVNLKYALKAEEIIWGKFIYRDVDATRLTLEMLNVYATRYYKCLQNWHIFNLHYCAFDVIPDLTSNPNIALTVSKFQEIEAPYILNPALRYLLYSNVFDQPKFNQNTQGNPSFGNSLWNDWRKTFNAKNDGTSSHKLAFSITDELFQFLKDAYGDEGFSLFKQHVQMLQANSFEIDSNKRFTSIFLFPFNIYALYHDAKIEGKNLQRDSNFFRGSGQIIFSMLKHVFNWNLKALDFQTQLGPLLKAGGFNDIEQAQSRLLDLKCELSNSLNHKFLQVATTYKKLAPNAHNAQFPRLNTSLANPAQDSGATSNVAQAQAGRGNITLPASGIDIIEDEKLQAFFNADPINQAVRILSYGSLNLNDNVDTASPRDWRTEFNQGNEFLCAYMDNGVKQVISKSSKEKGKLAFMPCKFDVMFYKLAEDVNFILQLSQNQFDTFEALKCVTHLYLIKYVTKRARQVYIATQLIKANISAIRQNEFKAESMNADQIKMAPYEFFLIESDPSKGLSQVSNFSQKLYQKFARMLPNEAEHYITYRVYRAILTYQQNPEGLSRIEDGQLTEDDIWNIVFHLIDQNPIVEEDDAIGLVQQALNLLNGPGASQSSLKAKSTKGKSCNAKAQDASGPTLSDLCSMLHASVSKRKGGDYSSFMTLAMNIGLLSKAGRMRYRFILSDKLLKVLVPLILRKQQYMRDKEFFEQLYTRFGIVIGPKEFNDMMEKCDMPSKCADKYLQDNAKFLCNRMEHLNLCVTLPDSSITYIKNPFYACDSNGQKNS